MSGSTLTDDDQFGLWDKWVGDIYEEVQILHIDRYIFREVQRIVQENPRIQQPSSFYLWMSRAYASRIIIGVRRHLYTGRDRSGRGSNRAEKQSMAFVRLLEDIIKRPDVLSRQRFVARYISKAKALPAEHAARLAHADFDKYAGPGEPHLPRHVVGADLGELKKAGTKIVQYANQWVAHLGRDRRDISPPSVPEVDDCLDLFEKVLGRVCKL
jgi:hypothetical protein